MCNLIEFDNGNYVADIKKKYIQNICDSAKDFENISRIVLFGSALQTRCTEKSDIDIAVFGKKSRNAYLKSKEFKQFQRKLFAFDDTFSQDYDVLYFCNDVEYNDAIMRDIKNGAEIYRREFNHEFNNVFDKSRYCCS